jgi:hypothetical protein
MVSTLDQRRYVVIVSDAVVSTNVMASEHDMVV